MKTVDIMIVDDEYSYTITDDITTMKIDTCNLEPGSIITVHKLFKKRLTTYKFIVISISYEIKYNRLRILGRKIESKTEPFKT